MTILRPTVQLGMNSWFDFGDGLRPIAPSHGENRGSSPLGSANNINNLHLKNLPVSRPCPVGILARERVPTPFALARRVSMPPKASRGLGFSFGVNFGARPTRQAARTYASSDDGEVCASGG